MMKTTLTMFLATALVGGAFAAPAAAAPVSAGTQSRAAIVAPMTLKNTDTLSFGSFGAGAAAGTVVINPDTGGRAVTGGVVALGGEISAAAFTGYTSGSMHVKVSVPKTAVTLRRAGGNETMAITDFTLDGKKNQKFPVDRIFTFFVGGTLRVSPNQADGVYEGSFAVTAEYQ